MAPIDTKENEAPKQSLPAGHPQAGYTAPALDGEQGTGTLPDSEKEWHEDRVQAQQDENDAIEQHEDEVAKQEAADQEAEQEQAEETQEEQKQAASKAKTSTPKDASS